MAKLVDADRIFLLKLARSVIASKLFSTEKQIDPNESPSSVLKENRGCFVTLHIDEALRGCIGTIEPIKPLVDNVIENAANAAFRDPRFPPLDQKEFPKIDIEVSVLTVPEVLEHADAGELLEKLKPNVHGVILAKGFRRSTFLPQVWKQLPDKTLFLEHLCQKGMMGRDCWKDNDTLVKVYEAEYFSEASMGISSP